MTIFDYAVLAVIAVSAGLSLMRGFLRETLSLAGWVAAFMVAKVFTTQLVPLLPQAIPGEPLRMMVAFLILFLATLLVSSLLAIALAETFKQVGLGWLDRWLGLLFGLARGVLIVGVLVLLAGLTALPRDVHWSNAMFSAPLEAAVQQVLPWIPHGLAQHVHYD